MNVLLIIFTSFMICQRIIENTQPSVVFIQGDDHSDSGIKRLLNFIVRGLKNLARIGRILKMNQLFFRSAPEPLTQFRFTPKERKLIYKLAQIVRQTYLIGDFDDIEVVSDFSELKNDTYNSSTDSSSSSERETARSEEFQVFAEPLQSKNKQNLDDKTAFITDSLKGIIYTSENTTVIAFKGTSLTLLGLDSSNTAKRDKEFDNLVFDCHPDPSKLKNILYIDAAQRVYDQIKHHFPKNKIILTGHSMGAAIASIIGHRNNEYVVSFASPGDRRIIRAFDLSSSKVESKEPRSVLKNLFHKIGTNTLHFGHCNDSIYRGTCNGPIDVCKLAGYDIKTRCHTGRKFCIGETSNFTLLKHTATSIVEALRKPHWDTFEVDQTDCDKNECDLIPEILKEE